MSIKKSWFLLAVLVLLMGVAVTTAQDAPAPLVLQDFEGQVELQDVYQTTTSISADVVAGGAGALASTSTEGEWHTAGAALAGAPVDISGFDKLCFAVNDTTAAGNTVGVKLLDASGAATERWTDNAGVGKNPKSVANEWTSMCLNLITYTGIDLTQISQIQFTMFAAGVYYFDDVTAQMFGEGEGTGVAEGPVALLQTAAQDFEAATADSIYSDYQADVSLGDIAHSGKVSLKATYAEGEWHAFGAVPATRPFDASGFDKVCFWVYDTTANNNGLADNTIGLSLIDVAGVKDEIWTDNVDGGTNPKTVKDTWTQMCIDLSAYVKADLKQIDKIQFAIYWAGDYYIDDISFAIAVPDPAAGLDLTSAQDFEAATADSVYSDYQADVSIGDVAHGGAASLKASSAEGEWHAFGVYPATRPFDASGYDKVCFWVYDTTANNNGDAANTIGVSLIDAAGVKDEIWTDHADAGLNPKTVKDGWVQMCINLSAYVKADLTQIDKIQFAVYWAGDYFVDDIAFGKKAAS